MTTTTAIAPTSAAATSAASGAKAATELAGNFQTFLTLLTAQLKNQDPLSPLDGTQFTQQLVSLSGVEAQLQTNDLLKTIAGNTGAGISTAVGLIGKDVRAVSDTANLVNGKAQWSYNLPAEASALKLEVVDANGRVVHAEAPKDLKAGDHDFTWNGLDPLGNKLPDGVYGLRVSALDASGAPINSTTFVQGRVTSVEQANGQTLITVNGTKVPWETVTSIKEPAPPPPPPSSTTANTDGSAPNPSSNPTQPAA